MGKYFSIMRRRLIRRGRRCRSMASVALKYSQYPTLQKTRWKSLVPGAWRSAISCFRIRVRRKRAVIFTQRRRRQGVSRNLGAVSNRKSRRKRGRIVMCNHSSMIHLASAAKVTITTKLLNHQFQLATSILVAAERKPLRDQLAAKKNRQTSR